MVQVLLQEEIIRQFSVTAFMSHVWTDFICARNINFVNNNIDTNKKRQLLSLRRRELSSLQEWIDLCTLLDHSCGFQSEIRIIH